jgi:hypothetical protein
MSKIMRPQTDQERTALLFDESAQHGFVLIGNIASREFNFEEHGLTPDGHGTIYEAIVAGLNDQGVYADYNTVGLSEMMHSEEYARDLIIARTVKPQPETSRIRGWALSALLRLYRWLRR